MKKKTIYKVAIVSAIVYLLAKTYYLDSKIEWIEAQNENVIEVLMTGR